MARATIEVTADVARYQAELAKIPGMTDKSAAKAALKLQQRMERAEQQAAKAAERAASKAAEANSAVGQFAENAELFERMRAALGPLGDSLADITGGADDLGTALGKASAKQVALVGGMVLLGAAALKAAGAVFDVLTNIEQYDENIKQLTDRKVLSAEDAQQLRDAATALDTLGTELINLAVSIASTIAPAVTVLVDLLSGMFSLVNAGMTGLSQFTNWLIGWEENAKTAASSQRQLNTELITQLRIADAQEKSTARQRQLEKNLAEDRASLAGMFAKDKEAEENRQRKAEEATRRYAAAQQELGALIKTALTAEADDRERIALQYGEQISKVETLMQLHPELAGQAQELIELYQAQRDAALGVFDDKSRAEQAKKERARIELEKKQIKEIQDAYDAQARAIIERQQQVQAAMLDSAGSIASNLESSLGSLQTMFNTSTREGRKAARSMAVAQRALAMFQVGVNLAQAISQSFAQGGPVAGAALAAAVSAAFAGLIATVSQPIPQFHTGRFGSASGMLSDERMTGGVMTVAPEVVIPPDLVSRAGGADGVRSRLEDDRPMIVQAVIDLTDERIVLPLARALGARERGRIGIPLGRT